MGYHPTDPSPFLVKDCTLVSIATGIKAQTLSELRDRLAVIHPHCIYYHFWGGRLRHEFEHREYHNDFSFWAHHALHDDVLSERLELMDPTLYDDVEVLRDDLVNVIENRIDEIDTIPWSKKEEQFYFTRSQIIVFSTRYMVTNPELFVEILPKLPKSSIFYHFIDAARRLPNGNNDFSAWLEGFGTQYEELLFHLKKIDRYFISLAHVQTQLVDTFSKFLKEDRDG